MYSKIELTFRHPQTGEKMHRTITDPRGMITEEEYQRICFDTMRAFGPVMSMATKEGINGYQRKCVAPLSADQKYGGLQIQDSR